MIINILRWIATLLIAFLAGKAVSKLKLPAILGWYWGQMQPGSFLRMFWIRHGTKQSLCGCNALLD